ncbi:hypothetical protein PMAYCL1PPCAC_25388, partial [Pristionchus mayeri]
MKPCPKNWMNISKQLVAAPIGGASWMLNALLLVAILSNRQLRSQRQYWLTMALAFADFAEGLASFIGALYRLPFYYSETACNDYKTPLQCMILPHNIIWRWSDSATAFMLVATALDRFIAISFPTFKGNRVAISMISFVFGISALCFFYAWIMPIQQTIAGTMLPAVCGTGGLIDEKYTHVSKYIAGAMSAISVLVHFIVAYKVHRFMRKVSAVKNFGEAPKISKQELTFTLTCLIKGLCTLILDSCPRIYGVYLLSKKNLIGVDLDNSGVGSFLFAFVALNGVMNVFVYAGGQKEV